MPIHGDKCRYCLSLCLSKSPNFVVKDQRNTFSNLICLLSNSYTKLGNVFQYTTLFRGIAAQISPKGSFCPTTIRLEREFCSSEFGRECPAPDSTTLQNVLFALLEHPPQNHNRQITFYLHQKLRFLLSGMAGDDP